MQSTDTLFHWLHFTPHSYVPLDSGVEGLTVRRLPSQEKSGTFQVLLETMNTFFSFSTTNLDSMKRKQQL